MKCRVLKECTQINEQGTHFARFFPGELIHLPPNEALRLKNDGCVEVFEERTVKPPENRKRGRPKKNA